VTAALAAAAATLRPLTRRGTGRSVSFATAMTLAGELRSSLSADTEVFYMAGRQLGELAERLLGAGWAADTAVLVVSRAGWPDQLDSTHRLAALGQASALHAGRPAVVTVGAGAAALNGSAGVAGVPVTRRSRPADTARIDTAGDGDA
jgi:uroporphyrin-III C-methyltransferase